ncbi:hypothetical protein C0992_009457, partial [Termitomyces sp. T32_za158]
ETYEILKRNLDSQQRQSFKLWHILYLLADAGALYAIFQLLNIVMGVAIGNQVAAGIAVDIVETIYFSISAVYPALTIALIHGPFSIAGVHDTVQSLRVSLPSAENPDM